MKLQKMEEQKMEEQKTQSKKVGAQGGSSGVTVPAEGCPCPGTTGILQQSWKSLGWEGS